MENRPLTMTHSTHILGVCRVTQSPMLHFHLLSALHLPYHIHQDIDGALCRHFRIAIQNRHTHNDAQALLASSLKYRLLAIELGLTVEVRWACRCICLVRCFARSSREDVVGANIDEKNAAVGAQLGQRPSCVDIKLACTLRVLVDLVRKAVCSAYSSDAV